MSKRRPLPKPVTPNVAIAADPPIPAISLPIKDAEAVVEFVADNSAISKIIGGEIFGEGGSEFWAHMTQHVEPGFVIDAREDAMTVLWHGAAPDERWKSLGDDRWCILEGVQLRPASYLLENPYSLKLGIACTSQQLSEFHQGLRDELGEPYDKAGIWSIATGKMTDPAWRGKKHPAFCDALGIWKLQQAKIVQRLMTPPYGRKPGAACDAVMATEGCRIISYRGQIPTDFLKLAGFDLANIPIH